MTPKRAKEIQCQSSQWPYWGAARKFMTEEEISEVTALWDTMPGSTCFNDALNRFARPKETEQ